MCLCSGTFRRSRGVTFQNDAFTGGFLLVAGLSPPLFLIFFFFLISLYVILSAHMSLPLYSLDIDCQEHRPAVISIVPAQCLAVELHFAA